MDSCWTLVCVATLLGVCVRCKSSEANTDWDQASHFRHLWLLSIKESMMKQKDINSKGKNNTCQLLYCRAGIGHHLQIEPSGTVRGVHEPTKYSWMRVFAVKPGVVGIRGINSRLYLCMNQEGIARGMTQFSTDCLLKEHIEENYYTTYSSATYPGLYLGLSHRGQLRRGNLVGPHHSSSHFLPRKVSVC